MRVVITGAAGRIGSQIAEELSSVHDLALSVHDLALVDRARVHGRTSVRADLAVDRAWTRWRPWSRSGHAAWTEAFEGADVVIHLAADGRQEAPWRPLLRNNIQATVNVMEAAVRHGVRRVVFASSNWAVKALERELAPACYTPDGPKIGPVPPRPLTPYGVSKAFGELTGRRCVDELGLGSFVAVRIGSYHPVPPKNEDARRLWIGPEDLRSLLRRCVEAEFEGFHVVYGVSGQPTAPYDLSETCRLLSWAPRQLLQDAPVGST